MRRHENLQRNFPTLCDISKFCGNFAQNFNSNKSIRNKDGCWQSFQVNIGKVFSTSLTRWGWVTHICVSKLTIIGSDNGLLPGRHQAIIWTNAGILLIGPLGTNFSEILIEIYIFSFMKIHLKLTSGIWQPFCLGLNVLIQLKAAQRSSCIHLSVNNHSL